MISEGTIDFLDSELTALEIAFRKRISMFLRGGMSNAEVAVLVGEIDFFQELQTAGLTNVIDTLEKEYGSIVQGIVKQAEERGLRLGGLTLRELDTILELDAENILNSAKTYSNQFQSSLIKGFLSGLTTNELVTSLDEIPLRTNQLIAAVNTAKDEFQAASMAKLFEDDPTVKFILAGPVDNRTRCQCKAVMLNQPKQGLTKKEIDGGAWTKIAKANCPKFDGEYTFIKRGGFNCRHYLQIGD